MEYKRLGGMYVMRIDRGEEVTAALTDFCQRENITAGAVSGLGACDQVTVGLYNVAEQQYHQQDFSGEFEITNLTGNISRKDGQVYLHLHITFSNDQFQTMGGHLNRCRISGTCELTVWPAAGQAGRQHDPVTGLNIYDLT